VDGQEVGGCGGARPVNGRCFACLCLRKEKGDRPGLAWLGHKVIWAERNCEIWNEQEWAASISLAKKLRRLRKQNFEFWKLKMDGLKWNLDFE
jgi:hypothetical protein